MVSIEGEDLRSKYKAALRKCDRLSDENVDEKEF